MIKAASRYNEVYQEFAQKMNVYDHQAKIEARKNQCMVCNFGRDGTAKLMEIVKPKLQQAN